MNVLVIWQPNIYLYLFLYLLLFTFLFHVYIVNYYLTKICQYVKCTILCLKKFVQTTARLLVAFYNFQFGFLYYSGLISALNKIIKIMSIHIVLGTFRLYKILHFFNNFAHLLAIIWSSLNNFKFEQTDVRLESNWMAKLITNGMKNNIFVNDLKLIVYFYMQKDIGCSESWLWSGFQT